MREQDRDKLFLGIANMFASYSTCLRGQTGAVIAKGGRILGTGYNGALPGMPHCKDVGCGGEVDGEFPNGCTRAVHAEANAVAFVARHGISCVGGTIYCTHSPCFACAQLIGSAGIYRVVFSELYRITEPIATLRKLGLVVDQVD